MLRIHALGGAVDVDLDGSGLDEARFRELWSRTLTDPQTPGTTHRVVRLNQPATYETATQSITRALIEQQWGRLLMLHAGAVAHPSTGRVLAFIAPGGTGKSTLTRLLGREFGYLTDETVGVVPETLEVLAYPKPVTWADVQGKPKREHSPESLGLLGAPEQPRLARLAVLRRSEGAQPTFTQLSLFDALEMVVPETSSLSKLPGSLQVLAEVFDRVGGVTLIEYGEAADILGWCREALYDPGVEPADGPAARVSTPLAAPASSTGGVGGNVLTGDGEAVVLLKDHLLWLGPVASRILHLWPSSVEDLATALEAEFGAPPGESATAAVEAQLQELTERGIIRR